MRDWQDDEYRGRRWRYGLLHRPITAYLIGRNGSGSIPHPILFSARKSADYPHGTADWAGEIPADEARHHSLVLVQVMAGEDEEFGPDSAQELLERGPR